MLEISHSAAGLIREMIDTLSGISGVRVALGPSESMNGTGPQLGVIIAPAPGPVGEDRTLVEDGIRVFVDPELAPLLDDKILDLVPAGADRVRFTLTARSQP